MARPLFLHDWLVSDFARDLEHGLYALDPDALEEGEHYLVADPAISIVNWHNSERWSRREE